LGSLDQHRKPFFLRRKEPSVIDKSVLNTLDDERFRALCGGVVNGMNRLPVPGAAVGILHEEKECVAGFGVTSMEHPLPVTADTLFQIGSNTKTYTATAIMRLVERGKLSLDTPLRHYLPDLQLSDKEVAARVTMRHLLTHTGGGSVTISATSAPAKTRLPRWWRR
jgi:CubicO group peptidase (beta-lactamase class C family)